MNNTELKRLLERAHFEILSLRRQNEILRAKVEIVEVFRDALHSVMPSNPQGYAEDVAWSLNEAVEDIERAEKAKPAVSAQTIDTPFGTIRDTIDPNTGDHV